VAYWPIIENFGNVVQLSPDDDMNQCPKFGSLNVSPAEVFSAGFDGELLYKVSPRDWSSLLGRLVF